MNNCYHAEVVMISYKSFHRVDADDGDNAAVAVVVAGAAAG